MASAVMGSVGAKVGSLAAGTFGWSAATWGQIGWTAGVLAANYLFAPDGPKIVNEGSRLDDLKVTSSAYGMHIPKVYGSYRIAGNIIWSLPLQETRHEEKQESSGKGGGGSSETTIWYTYKGNFAVALCEGEVSGVRKIWAGSKLIYDISDSASFATIESSSIEGANFTIYRGTDDQEINWRMQQSNPDSPAYRHICYILFHDFELESYQNIIPNITAEVVKSGSQGTSLYTIYESEGEIYYGNLNGIRSKVITNTDGDYYYLYSNGVNGDQSLATRVTSNYYNRGDTGESTYLLKGLDSTYEAVSRFKGTTSQNAVLTDVIHNTHILETVYPNSVVIKRILLGASVYGSLIVPYRIYTDNEDVHTFLLGDFATGTGTDPSTWCIGVFGTGGDNTYYRYYNYTGTDYDYVPVTEKYDIFRSDVEYYAPTTTELHILNKIPYYTNTSSTTTISPSVVIPLRSHFKQYVYGYGGQDVILAPADFGSDDVVGIYINADRIYTLMFPANKYEPYIKIFDLTGLFLEYIYLIDYIDFYGMDTLNTSALYIKFQVSSEGMHIILPTTVLKYYHIRLTGDTSVTGQKYLGEVLLQNNRYVTPVNGTYYSSIEFFRLLNTCHYNFKTKTLKMMNNEDEYILYYSIISSTSISLADIVEELLIDSGYAIEDYDVTDGLGTQVDGYVITRNMPSRSAIEPLLSAYDFSLMEKDHKIYLLKNQQLSIANISEEDLGANSDNKLEYKVSQEIDLIKRLTVRYANRLSDYQTSVQSMSRIDTSATEERIVELPLALSDDQAKRIVEKNIYYNWLIRQTFSFKLSLYYKDLIAGDIITINYDGYVKDIKLTKITITEDGILDCSGIANNYGVHDSNAIGTDTGINGGEVTEAIDEAKWEILDIHTLSNSYINEAGVYVTASGVSNSWRGATFYSKANQVDDFSQNISLVIPPAHIGVSYGILPDASTHIWDEVNIIAVSSDHDLTTTSLTKDTILANGLNYIIIGDEILQYVTATEVGPNRYELSILLRGRRGTEYATSSHLNRERFVFLDSQKIGFIPKTIGSTDYYLAVSLGLILNISAQNTELQYEGKNLKPFSPSYFRGIRSGTDIDLQWMRRSRYISGYFKTLPLVESSEEYVIEVYDDIDVLLQTITGITTNTYTYDITSDSLTTADDVKFKVYQISSVVGKGYESEYILIEGI